LLGLLFAGACVLYTAFHIGVMNLYPLETWVYRLIHVSCGLALGFIFFSARAFPARDSGQRPATWLEWVLLLPAAVAIFTALVQITWAIFTDGRVATGAPPQQMLMTFGYPILLGTVLAILASWVSPQRARDRLPPPDLLLAVAAITVGLYIISHAEFLRFRASVFPHGNDMYAAIAGILLILEMTRRLAGLALVVIVAIFIAYPIFNNWPQNYLDFQQDKCTQMFVMALHLSF
jgi:TRAP-type uncharacterized transport system fused permease subunit